MPIHEFPNRLWDPEEKKETIRPVTWIGKAVASAMNEEASDLSQHPVRIRKDAFCSGVPYKDLLITSEHCVFWYGAFVPIRMLINGITITYEDKIECYDYYHLEFEKHSIIWANGLQSESYLASENRDLFSGNIAGHSNTPPSRLWGKDSAAPLQTKRAFVEPIFQWLDKRARDQNPGFCRKQKRKPDFRLRLLTEWGDLIEPLRQNGEWVTFAVCEKSHHVWLHSEVFRPCDVVGPFVDDRRQLGVLVGTIKVFASDTSYDLITHLVSPYVPGWRELEQGSALRWTNGDARVDLTEGPASAYQRLISFQIVQPGEMLH